MKRYMTRVSLLLITALLVSCGGDDGGGGTTSGGGNTAPPNSANPAPPDGGNPGNDGGGSTSAGALVEESDASVTLSAGWIKSDSRWGWSGGTAMQSTVAGTRASFTFTGTSVRWIGRRSRESGIALVSVDGGPAREVDLFARPREIRTPILTIYGLSDGPHTLTIEVTGRQNPNADSNLVVVDAFEVEPQILSHLQESDPDAAYIGGWVHLDEARWSGGGVFTPNEPAIGGARAAETEGAKVTLKFRGTSIKWMGYRGPNAGIARVQVDGGPASEVDTYSPAEKVQEVVFSATGLADKTHTLTIEATGRKNAASTGAQIVVDAFDVTTPGRRYQDKDRSITYSGHWNHGGTSRPWSEGTASTANTPGSRATFSFTGTSVSWVSCQKASAGGTARVYIDGAFVTEVRNHRSAPIEGFQRTVFRKDGLTNGPHTLTIEVISEGSYVVLDAFDVHPAPGSGG